MNFTKQTTYQDVWLLIALLALIAGAHEYDFQDEQQRLIHGYYYGE